MGEMGQCFPAADPDRASCTGRSPPRRTSGTRSSRLVAALFDLEGHSTCIRESVTSDRAPSVGGERKGSEPHEPGPSRKMFPTPQRRHSAIVT